MQDVAIPRAARDVAAPRWAAPLAGAVAVGLALGVAELIAALLRGARSPVGTVGEQAIDLVPDQVRNAAIGLLGFADKPVLVGGILVVCLAAGAGIGLRAQNGRRAWVRAAVLGFGLFALLGGTAAIADPLAAGVPTTIAIAIGAAAGLMALRYLLRDVDHRSGSPSAAAEEAVDGGEGHPEALARSSVDADSAMAAPQRFDRRTFVRGTGVVAALAMVLGVTGTRLAARARTLGARSTAVLPTAAVPLPPPPPGAALDIKGLSPLVTPNEDFYRIDTALSVPRVDVEAWRLRVTGMVAREQTLTYQDLLELPMVEADVTLTCVSNEVGGRLVGTARWLGVPLADILARSGVSPAATQVIGRSVDGWTGGFPTAIAMDGRDALVAVAMNGEMLPIEHGFPARLVVPGLYGYVSATKWLTEIELTTWEGVDGYWIPRGCAKEGPVRTQSRIDVPQQGSSVPAGQVAVAGVAWAQHRGIERVEVRIDGSSWEEARLAEALSVDTWRQWVLTWDAQPGEHVIEVRATDGDGETQTEEREEPRPAGATGWHRIGVTITGAR